MKNNSNTAPHVMEKGIKLDGKFFANCGLSMRKAPRTREEYEEYLKHQPITGPGVLTSMDGRPEREVTVQYIYGVPFVIATSLQGGKNE